MFVPLAEPVPCMMTGTHQVHRRHCLRGEYCSFPAWAIVKWSSGELSYRDHLSGEGCVSGGLGGLDNIQARASCQAQPTSDVAGPVGAHKQREMVRIVFMRVFLS